MLLNQGNSAFIYWWKFPVAYKLLNFLALLQCIFQLIQEDFKQFINFKKQEDFHNWYKDTLSLPYHKKI